MMFNFTISFSSPLGGFLSHSVTGIAPLSLGELREAVRGLT